MAEVCKISKEGLKKRHLFYIVPILGMFFCSPVAFAASVIVEPGVPDHFDLKAPELIQAGKDFKLIIEAKDALDNLIVDYYQTGKGVEVLTNGRGAISPVEVLPWSFEDGRATVYFTYNAAESFSITVREKDGRILGVSSLIHAGVDKVNISGNNQVEQEVSGPGEADHFLVITPANVVAGQTFNLIIEARDREDRLITDYNLTDNEVEVLCEPSGKNHPVVIKAGSFDKGRAVVVFKCVHSGITTIMAKQKEPGVTNKTYSDVKVSTLKTADWDNSRQRKLDDIMAQLDSALEGKLVHKAGANRPLDAAQSSASEPKISGNKKNSKDLIRKAEQLIEQEDYVQAVNILEKALNMDPADQKVKEILKRLKNLVAIMDE